jgi:hypothetical protein
VSLDPRPTNSVLRMDRLVLTTHIQGPRLETTDSYVSLLPLPILATTA